MNNSFRPFKINDKTYVFCVDAFKKAFDKEKTTRNKQQKCTAEKLREDIADALNISSETVKKWYQGLNGPIDEETVKRVADFFEIDYMNLLIDRNGEADMNTEKIITRYDEKEIVLEVFKKIVEIIWLETERFKPNYYDAKYQDEDTFISRWNELYQQAFQTIDMNSLSISYQTRIKLYNILAETRKSRSGMEDAPGRWLRLNHKIFDARLYFNEGGFTDEDEETWIQQLHTDAEGTIERPYYVEYNRCCYECFNKSTTIAEAARIVGIPEKEVVLIPYEDGRFGFQYDPNEIYRFEFMKTIILVFREDFPEYFPE